MSDKKWTPQQWDAIAARGGTVLVSAAAGSGKTAVLVERVVGRILDEENPVDADRMLIVTFSNAAALEMKQRITTRIGKMLRENPQDAQLQRQRLLLDRAQISTIHSFCLELIRSNFQQLGLPSNIRVADQKELDILRRDCAQETVEQFHRDDQDGEFSGLVELLSSGRDDSRVFSTLFTLYDFVRSHPFYDRWLTNRLSFYSDAIRVSDSIWGRCILRYAAEAINYACSLVEQAYLLMEGEEAMTAAYRDAFAHDLEQLTWISGLVERGEWDKICEGLCAFTHDKLRPLKGDDSKKGAVQSLRGEIKEIVKALREKQFCATAQEFAEDIAQLRPSVAMLFELTRAFDRNFTAAKQQKNKMDFSDMEHYALRLLVSPAGAGYEKTALARSEALRYDEILIDEFQDTNAAQEMIFRAISQAESNLFMVGDVKQSIYRFRQAMPELFMNKKKRYAAYDGSSFPAKITLGRNFRSVPEVTDSINFFFSLLMSEPLGEIDYNDEESLVAGAEFPPHERVGCSLELLDLEHYVGERDKAGVEAEYVAERIARMLEQKELVAQGEQMRSIRPSDICILLRSPSGKAQLYMDALTARGVPVWAEPKSSFLSTKEIAPVLALLRVLGNPLLDIELAAVMLSALFGFSADELAKVRLTKRREPLYLGVSEAAKQGDAHCRELLDILAQLRQYASGATADAVIRLAYELTDYMGKVQVMRMGDKRRANLLLLVQYACDYHANGYKGISGFVGFLDRLIDRGSDLTPAAGLSEQADVVRIMSIHRSKGLEFPIVFLCDSAKRFNKEDLNGNTLLHSELGFACVRRDFALMKQFTTVPMQALRLELTRSMLSEELRVLYVALTRAKERIIITGTATKLRDKLTGLVSPVEKSGKLSVYPMRSALSYLDWLLMAAVHHCDLSPALAALGIETDLLPDRSKLDFQIVEIADDMPLAQEQQMQPVEADMEQVEELAQRLTFVYPYAVQTCIPTKMAVSQLAKGEMAKSYRFSRRPVFLQEHGLTAAQKGNATHKFMQFSDYHAAAQNLSAEMKRMVDLGFLSCEEADAVSLPDLERFFCSSLAQRIFSAERVYRELRFLAEAGRELLGDYSSLFDASGKTAIQGVADCVFIEAGRGVIVDYKTDHVKCPQELADRYRIQLKLYREVLTQSLGIPITECILYSFALSKEISVD